MTPTDPETPLPAGFEFVVSDCVPSEVGLRQLNDRTFEAHPDTYAALFASHSRSLPPGEGEGQP
jgi:hypothetical protein